MLLGEVAGCRLLHAALRRGARAHGDEGAGNLWQQSLRGGEPQPLTSFDQGLLETFALSPDGQRLAVERVTEISDVALIHDFR